MINGQSYFDLSRKNDLRTYDKIWKIVTGQWDATGCLLYYNYLKKYKMIAMDLSKQKVLNSNRWAIQKINFTGNLNYRNNTTMFLIIEEAKDF